MFQNRSETALSWLAVHAMTEEVSLKTRVTSAAHLGIDVQ
jgi:hypothetical protein